MSILEANFSKSQITNKLFVKKKTKTSHLDLLGWERSASPLHQKLVSVASRAGGGRGQRISACNNQI